MSESDTTIANRKLQECSRDLQVTTETVESALSEAFHVIRATASENRELKRQIVAAKAEALREFANSINEDAIADEWQGPRGDGHWSAGNAASAIQNAAFDRADEIERTTDEH